MMANILWSTLGLGLAMNSAVSFGQQKIRSLVRWLKSVRMQRLGAKIVRTRIHSAFHASFDSAAFQKVKKSKMDRTAIKDLLYGGMMEMMKNRQYYYNSGVNSSYNSWTEEGKIALAEYMNLVSGKMWEAEQVELNARARELVLKELKTKS
jgi:hypothetical protein